MSLIQLTSLTDKLPDGSYVTNAVFINPEHVNVIRPSYGIQMGKSIVTMTFTPREHLGKFDEGKDLIAVDSPVDVLSGQFPGLVAITVFDTVSGKQTVGAYVNPKRVKKITQSAGEYYTLHFTDGSNLDIVDSSPVVNARV